MDSRAVHLSTHEASSLLGVHESSLKRWCNADELPYDLTPGGHRRIPIGGLVAFARERGIEFALSHFGDDAATVWTGFESVRRSDDYAALDELVYCWLQDGRSDMIAYLTEFLTQNGILLGAVMDHLIVRTMQRVGHGYVRGEVSIGTEHLMTQCLRDALILLTLSRTSSANSGAQAANRAVVGTLSGEAHELGALMTRLVLTAHGWTVTYAGLDIPTEEIAALQASVRAQLVCISVAPPRGPVEARSASALLERLADPDLPYALIFGGAGIDPELFTSAGSRSFLDKRSFQRMALFEDWLKTFKHSGLF